MQGKLEVFPFDRGDAPEDQLARALLANPGQTPATSETLPPAAYSSQAFYDLEVERVFMKDWLCVGHVSQVAKVGDYFSIDLLGEPMMVVRAEDRIRALSRVCLHRWAPVVSGTGNAKVLSCPFHKWGYALDGQLLGAPFMDGAAGFEPKACRLPEFRTEIVESLGLIFVTFSETVGSISERLEDLSEYLKDSGMKDMVVVRTNVQENDYNWKILIETFMECYHHIGAHRETLEPDFPARLSYCEPARKGWSLCHSPLREDIPEEGREDHQKAFSLYNIFPSLLMGSPMDVVRPERMNFIITIPLGPNRVRSLRHTLVPRSVAETPEALEKLDKRQERFAKVNKEDNEVNDMQQLGAGSMLALPGRLSHLEGTVWDLAEYIRSRMGAN